MEIFNKNTILSIFLYYFRNFEKKLLKTGYDNFILFIDDFREHTWIFPLIGLLYVQMFQAMDIFILYYSLMILAKTIGWENIKNS